MLKFFLTVITTPNLSQLSPSQTYAKFFHPCQRRFQEMPYHEASDTWAAPGQAVRKSQSPLPGPI